MIQPESQILDELYCGLPFDRSSAVSGGVCMARPRTSRPRRPGLPRRLRPDLAQWQLALKDQSGREVSLPDHGDSGAGGEVVESGTGDVEQDSFDERLSILTPDAVGRARYMR